MRRSRATISRALRSRRGRDRDRVGPLDLRARGLCRGPNRRLVASARHELARALELAAAAEGRAYPKPTVGAVVVRDGDIVAEGVTEQGGRHGEVVALDAAGELARGATLYVTLEPCAHWGTTPPCTRPDRRGRASRGSSSGRATRTRRRPAGSGAPRGRRRGRAPRRVGGARPERGLADVGVARAGRSSPTRPRRRSTAASTLPGERLGHGRGEPPARARAARGVGRRRGRDGHRARRRAAPRCARRADAARPAAPARVRPGPLPEGSELELRSGPLADELRGARGARASSRSCSRAGRRSPARSSTPASSTSCSSSSRPSSPEAAAPFAARLGSAPGLSHRLSARHGRGGRSARSLCPRALRLRSSAPTTRSSACSRSG